MRKLLEREERREEGRERTVTVRVAGFYFGIPGYILHPRRVSSGMLGFFLGLPVVCDSTAAALVPIKPDSPRPHPIIFCERVRTVVLLFVSFFLFCLLSRTKTNVDCASCREERTTGWTGPGRPIRQQQQKNIAPKRFCI